MSVTLLTHPNTGHGEDNTFTLIRTTRGHWTTTPRAVIPLEVIASPVDTRNTFSHLASDDASSTASAPPMDTDTTLSLRHVLLETTPPNIIDNSAARTIATIHQHAGVADSTFNAQQLETLLDALAKLAAVEASVITMSMLMCTSLKNIRKNIRGLAAKSQALTICMEEQAATSKSLTDCIDKHAKQLSNLLELKKACYMQTDKHWQHLDSIMMVIKCTDASIAATVKQNKHLTAQMAGLCTTAETAATSACQDINNLRACLIPDLCDASTSLLKEMTSLHGQLTSLDAILAGQATDATSLVAAPRANDVSPTSVATPPGAPTGTPTGVPISVPPGAPTGAPTGTLTDATPNVPTNDDSPTGPLPDTSDPANPHYHPTQSFDLSWYHNTHNRQNDNAAGEHCHPMNVNAGCDRTDTCRHANPSNKLQTLPGPSYHPRPLRLTQTMEHLPLSFWGGASLPHAPLIRNI
jgi:hypothetical protein